MYEMLRKALQPDARAWFGAMFASPSNPQNCRELAISEKRAGNIAKRRLLVNPYGPALQLNVAIFLGENNLNSEKGGIYARPLCSQFFRRYNKEKFLEMTLSFSVPNPSMHQMVQRDLNVGCSASASVCWASAFAAWNRSRTGLPLT